MGFEGFEHFFAFWLLDHEVDFYLGLIEVFNHLCTNVNATETHDSLSIFWLNFYICDLAIFRECFFKQEFRKTEAFLPLYLYRSELFIILVGLHFAQDLFSQFLSFFLFFHLFLKILFFSFEFLIHVSTTLVVLFLSSFELIEHSFAVLTHGLFSEFLLFKSLDLVLVNLPVFLFLQKLIRQVDLNEFILCRVLLVPVRMEL